jgi:hypothetical protein
MMAQDSGSRLWDLVASVPPDRLTGPPEDLELIRAALIYRPVREVRRVVFIATPHRGARLDSGPLLRVGTKLVRSPDALRAAHAKLLASNRPDRFTPLFRAGLPTSVEQLAWQHPLLMAIAAAGCDERVAVHSIVADRRDPPRPGGSDGVVSYDSAHLDGPFPEILVGAGHVCLDRPDVIRAVAGILSGRHLDGPG